MDNYREYFPTKPYKNAVMKFGVFLKAERDRLDTLAQQQGQKCAISVHNLLTEMPNILNFTRKYHEYFSLYLSAVLQQQPRKIQCKASCGNCCHHYPMSVEPFELLNLYYFLRKKNDFLWVMESCQMRSSLYKNLCDKRIPKAKNEEEAEDLALQDYFSIWHPCPFSDKLGDCKIYPYRPVSCRMYFCETDPNYCTPEYLFTDKNDSYIVYLPDSIEEAIYGISEHYKELDLNESFFGGLLSVNVYEGLFSNV